MVTNNSRPFFSIIIPIYNVNLEYFSVCMESLLNQSFDSFEVILVDDGSCEECAAACDKYSEGDDRVRVLHQENQGVSVARNRGMEEATADWIMFVDADDWLEMNACEILYGYLCKVDCDILLFRAYKEYGAKRVRQNYGLTNETLYIMDENEIREMLYGRAMGSPNTKNESFCVIYYSWDKVFKRSFLVENGIRYPVGIPKSEDKIFILQCFEKMHSMYYVESELYHYRINEKSACNRYSETADVERIMLARQLNVIAERMDSELGEKRNDGTYHGITKQFYRFTFGIITDVFKQKFYHPEYPRSKKMREAEVKEFLCTEPIRTSIKNVKYSELSRNARIKKFLISHGFSRFFFRLKRAKINSTGKVAGK